MRPSNSRSGTALPISTAPAETLLSHPLPRLHAISPEPPPAPGAAAFLRQLGETLQRHGPLLLQLRARELALEPYLELAQAVHAMCRKADSLLLLNHPALPAAGAPVGDGVHWPSAVLLAQRSRPHASVIVSAACHTAAQLHAAQGLGVDAVTLSPVQATLSHPGAAALGWAAFAALAAHCEVPVYALGGVAADDLARACAHGAYGVAGIRGFWGGSAH